MHTEWDALPGTAPWRGASSGAGAAARCGAGLGARAREAGLSAAEPLPFRSGPGFMQRWREMKAEERGVFSPCSERAWKQPASGEEGQSLIPEAEGTPSAPLLLQTPGQCQHRGMFCDRSFLFLSGPLRRPQRSFEALAGLGGWQSPGRRERSPAARHGTAAGSWMRDPVGLSRLLSSCRERAGGGGRGQGRAKLRDETHIELLTCALPPAPAGAAV